MPNGNDLLKNEVVRLNADIDESSNKLLSGRNLGNIEYDNLEPTPFGNTGVGDQPEYDQGVNYSAVQGDPTALNEIRARNQPWEDQAINALVGGTAKGLNTAVEGLASVTPGLGLGNTLSSLFGQEVVARDAVSEWANQNKQDLSQEYPIFHSNPGAIDLQDSGFYWDTVGSIIESGVGYGISGAATGGLFAGATKLGALSKLYSASGKVAQTAGWLGAGATQNLTEGKASALELYDTTMKTILPELQKQQLDKMNTFNTRLEEEIYNLPIGIPEEEYRQQRKMEYAQTLGANYKIAIENVKNSVAKQASAIQQRNILLMGANLMQMKGLFSLGGALRVNPKTMVAKALADPKRIVTEGGKIAVSEGAEEYAQEISQQEAEYQVSRAAGITPAKELTDRLIDFGTSGRSAVAFATGFISGPVQNAITRGVGDYVKNIGEGGALNDKIAEQQDVVNTINLALISKETQEVENHNARIEEAMLSGDEVETSRRMEESFSDLFYRNAKAQNVHNLESQINELGSKNNQTAEGIADDARQRASAMKGQIPKLEKVFLDTQKASTDKEGNVNEYKHKVLYDLASRAEMAGNALKNTSTELRNVQREITDLQRNQVVEPSSVVKEHQNLTAQKSSLTAKQKVFETLDGIKTPDALLTYLQEENNYLNGDKDLIAKLKGSRKNAKAAFKSFKAATAKNGSAVKYELGNVETRLEEIQEEVDKAPKVFEVPESLIKQADALSRNQANYGAVRDLYQSTYEEDLKPESESEFNEAQDKIMSAINEYLTNPDVVSETQMAEEAAKPEVPVEVDLLQEAFDKAKAENDAANEKIRVAAEYSDELANEITTKEATPENLDAQLTKAVDKGIAKDEETFVKEELPKLLNKAQNDEAILPEGVAKEAYIKRLEELQSYGNAKYGKEVKDPSEEELDTLDTTESIPSPEQAAKEVEDADNDLNTTNDQVKKSGYGNERLLSVPNSIAFNATNIQDEDAKRFVEYVEDPTNNMPKHKVRYALALNGENLAENEALAVELVMSGKPLNAKNQKFVSENMPLRMILTKDGKDVLVDGQQVYSYAHSVNYNNYADVVQPLVDKFRNEVRPEIVLALLEGKSPVADITNQREGYGNYVYQYRMAIQRTAKDVREGKIRYNTFIVNTQDPAQNAKWLRDKEDEKAYKPHVQISNNISNVTGAKPVIAVSATPGQITYTEGNKTISEISPAKAKGRMYFKLVLPNGNIHWSPAFTRDYNKQEKELLNELRTNELNDELKTLYSDQLQTVTKATGIKVAELTADNVLSFYVQNPELFKANGGKLGKFYVKASKLGDSKYVEAVTSGAEPILYTTLAPLETGGREGLSSAYMQTTIQVSSDFTVEGEVKEEPVIEPSPTDRADVVDKLNQSVNAQYSSVSDKAINQALTEAGVDIVKGRFPKYTELNTFTSQVFKTLTDADLEYNIENLPEAIIDELLKSDIIGAKELADEVLNMDSKEVEEFTKNYENLIFKAIEKTSPAEVTPNTLIDENVRYGLIDVLIKNGVDQEVALLLAEDKPLRLILEENRDVMVPALLEYLQEQLMPVPFEYTKARKYGEDLDFALRFGARSEGGLRRTEGVLNLIAAANPEIYSDLEANGAVAKIDDVLDTYRKLTDTSEDSVRPRLEDHFMFENTVALVKQSLGLRHLSTEANAEMIDSLLKSMTEYLGDFSKMSTTDPAKLTLISTDFVSQFFSKPVNTKYLDKVTDYTTDLTTAKFKVKLLMPDRKTIPVAGYSSAGEVVGVSFINVGGKPYVLAGYGYVDNGIEGKHNIYVPMESVKDYKFMSSTPMTNAEKEAVSKGDIPFISEFKSSESQAKMYEKSDSEVSQVESTEEKSTTENKPEESIDEIVLEVTFEKSGKVEPRTVRDIGNGVEYKDSKGVWRQASTNQPVLKAWVDYTAKLNESAC